MWLPAPPVGLWNYSFGMPVADLDVLGKYLVRVCVRACGRRGRHLRVMHRRSRRSLLLQIQPTAQGVGRAALLVPDLEGCGAALRSGWIE